MKKINRAKAAEICAAMIKNDAATAKINWAATHNENEILKKYSSSVHGIDGERAEELQSE